MPFEVALMDAANIEQYREEVETLDRALEVAQDDANLIEEGGTFEIKGIREND